MNKWLDDRLTELRKTKVDLGKALGQHHARIHEIIKGKRQVKAKEVPALAAFLEWPEAFVWEKINRHRAQSAQLPIKGYIGAGAEIIPIDDHATGAGIDYADVPPLTGVTAAKVRGDSQLPVYRDGDVILYPNERMPPNRLIGVECAVQLAEPDGRLLIKTIKRGGAPRTFTLASHNASDIEDVEIEWASPVLWVKRG